MWQYFLHRLEAPEAARELMSIFLLHAYTRRHSILFQHVESKGTAKPIYIASVRPLDYSLHIVWMILVISPVEQYQLTQLLRRLGQN